MASKKEDRREGTNSPDVGSFWLDADWSKIKASDKCAACGKSMSEFIEKPKMQASMDKTTWVDVPWDVRASRPDKLINLDKLFEIYRTVRINPEWREIERSDVLACNCGIIGCSRECRLKILHKDHLQSCAIYRQRPAFALKDTNGGPLIAIFPYDPGSEAQEFAAKQQAMTLAKDWPLIRNSAASRLRSEMPEKVVLESVWVHWAKDELQLFDDAAAEAFPGKPPEDDDMPY